MFHDDMAVFDGVILKDRHVGIPQTLQRQALEQLHGNHMGMKKQLHSSHMSQFIRQV